MSDSKFEICQVVCFDVSGREPANNKNYTIPEEKFRTQTGDIQYFILCGVKLQAETSKLFIYKTFHCITVWMRIKVMWLFIRDNLKFSCLSLGSGMKNYTSRGDLYSFISGWAFNGWSPPIAIPRNARRHHSGLCEMMRRGD